MKRYFQRALETTKSSNRLLQSASGWVLLLGIGVIFRSVLILSKSLTASDTISGVLGLIIGIYLVVYYGGLYVTIILDKRRGR